jgi:hypothetical protein
MGEGPFAPLIWVAVIILVGVLFVRTRRRRRHIGSAAAGTIYDWLNEEKRNAVEVIVEDKAAYKDPEDKDGNLPDLG